MIFIFFCTYINHTFYADRNHFWKYRNIKILKSPSINGLHIYLRMVSLHVFKFSSFCDREIRNVNSINQNYQQCVCSVNDNSVHQRNIHLQQTYIHTYMTSVICFRHISAHFVYRNVCEALMSSNCSIVHLVPFSVHICFVELFFWHLQLFSIIYHVGVYNDWSLLSSSSSIHRGISRLRVF